MAAFDGDEDGDAAFGMSRANVGDGFREREILRMAGMRR